MKRKIICCLVLLLSLCILTSCDKNIKEDKTTPTKAEDKLIIDDIDLTLTETGSFEELSFMYPKDTQYSSLGTYTMLIYNKDGNELFRIGISKFNGKVEDQQTGAFNYIGSSKINNNLWEVFSDTEGNTLYGIDYNDSNFLVSFIYEKQSLKKFENEFMKKVILN